MRGPRENAGPPAREGAGRSLAARTALWLLLAAWSLSGVPAQSASTVEYRVKAAMLYNFTRFVSWPSDALGSGPDLRVCVLGEDPFGDSLRALVGKPTGDKALAVRRSPGTADADGCPVVFIAASEAPRLSEILARLGQGAVLTVSDIDGFVESGGMIGMTLVGGKVRFEVNVAAAKRAGLSISSKLLKLALSVHGG